MLKKANDFKASSLNYIELLLTKFLMDVACELSKSGGGAEMTSSKEPVRPKAGTKSLAEHRRILSTSWPNNLKIRNDSKALFPLNANAAHCSDCGSV